MAKLVIHRDISPRGVSDALRLVSFEGVVFGAVSREEAGGTWWSFDPDEDDDLPRNLRGLVAFDAQYLRQIRAELESDLRDRG